MRKIFLILFIIFFSCKKGNTEVVTVSENINSVKLSEIKDPILHDYIENEIKDFIKPKISICKDCNPKMFKNDTIFGITEFNKEMIYYNKLLKVSNYSIESYLITYKEKDFNNEIKDRKIEIFHWTFYDEVSKTKFLNHIEFYNRALGKYKEESEVIIYKNEIFQNQYHRF